MARKEENLLAATNLAIGRVAIAKAFRRRLREDSVCELWLLDGYGTKRSNHFVGK